jgi:hypothetical protein
MATVTVKSIAPDRMHMNKKVFVTFEIQTSVGRSEQRIVIEDQGQSGANEDAARQKLGTFLREAFEALTGTPSPP